MRDPFPGGSPPRERRIPGRGIPGRMGVALCAAVAALLALPKADAFYLGSLPLVSRPGMLPGAAGRPVPGHGAVQGMCRGRVGRSFARTSMQAQEDKAEEGAGAGKAQAAPAVSSRNKGEEFTNFAMTTFLQSEYYVGREDLHLIVPIVAPEDYPEWIPKLLRFPKPFYTLIERGVEEGWIKKCNPGDVQEIKYGVFRGVVSRERCEACDEAEASAKRNEAAESLVNIGRTERYRRASLGSALYLVATVTGLLTIVSGAGPLTRFTFVCMPALLAFAFTESGRTGL